MYMKAIYYLKCNYIKTIPEKLTHQYKQSYEGEKTGLPEHETRKPQTPSSL